MRYCWGEEIRRKSAQHQNVAVGEIDEAQDAIHHRVAEGDERVNGTEREAVD